MNVGYNEYSIPRPIYVTVNISHRQNNTKLNMFPTKKNEFRFEKGCQSENKLFIYEKPSVLRNTNEVEDLHNV